MTDSDVFFLAVYMPACCLMIGILICICLHDW